jgi:hypothetical protein
MNLPGMWLSSSPGRLDAAAMTCAGHLAACILGTGVLLMLSALASSTMMGVSLAMALILSACSSIAGTCTDELRVRITPQDTTLAAGRAFSPAVSLSTCGGKQRLEDSFTFQSTNPAVASVEPTTRRVVAVRSGEADILVTGQQYGNVGRIRVTVSP